MGEEIKNRNRSEVGIKGDEEKFSSYSVKILDIHSDADEDDSSLYGSEDKVNLLIYHVSKILEILGEDLNRDGLKKTPERYARALLEVLSGYEDDPNQIINGAIFDQEYNGIVTVSNIKFFSMCEHHILPFFGLVSVSYIPQGKIIGLSKIPRVVKSFSSRLQVQERLTEQIGKFLEETLNPKGVAVYISAVHLCLAMRGAKKENAKMETIYLSGEFKSNPEIQKIFLEHIKRDGDIRFFF